MSLDSDPEIAAAFSSADTKAPAPVSDDPEIHAAFASTEDKAEKTDEHKIGDELVQPVVAGLSSAAHSVVGGYKGLYTLATTRNLEKAAKAVTDEQAKAYTYTPPARSAPTNLGPQATVAMADANTLPSPTALGDIAASHGASPGLSTALAVAPTALSMMAVPRSLGPQVPAATAQEIAAATAAKQSGGAAGAAPNVSAASPELQTAIQDAARKTGGAVNPDALQAHLEADQHGIQMTKGQVTRDPAQFSNEQNSTHPDLVNRISAQNGQMVDAIDNIRRDASPTTVSNSPRENGQVVLDDLKAYDKPIVEKVSAAYDEANAANVAAGKGALKLDPKPAVDHAAGALEDREDLLPSEGKAILEKMKDAAKSGEGIPLKQAETWKTIISRASRKYERSGDTNAVSALSDFRTSLEQMAPTNASAPVLAKFNNARALSKARFDELDADPAYRAAVNDSTPKGETSPLADTFLDDYALNRGAPKAQIDRMMGKLGEEGTGAVASHTLSAIRKGAVNASGNVLPNGYNTAVAKYADKLPSLVSSDVNDSLQSLGRVITNAKVAPPGSFVNYSKSGVISNAAHGLGEVALGQVPIAKHGIPIIKGIMESRFAKDAIAPGAGLDQLKTRP
jgi:hypothetical protein